MDLTCCKCHVGIAAEKAGGARLLVCSHVVCATCVDVGESGALRCDVCDTRHVFFIAARAHANGTRPLVVAERLLARLDAADAVDDERTSERAAAWSAEKTLDKFDLLADTVEQNNDDFVRMRERMSRALVTPRVLSALSVLAAARDVVRRARKLRSAERAATAFPNALRNTLAEIVHDVRAALPDDDELVFVRSYLAANDATKKLSSSASGGGNDAERSNDSGGKPSSAADAAANNAVADGDGDGDDTTTAGAAGAGDDAAAGNTAAVHPSLSASKLAASRAGSRPDPVAPSSDAAPRSPRGGGGSSGGGGSGSSDLVGQLPRFMAEYHNTLFAITCAEQHVVQGNEAAATLAYSQLLEKEPQCIPALIGLRSLVPAAELRRRIELMQRINNTDDDARRFATMYVEQVATTAYNMQSALVAGMVCDKVQSNRHRASSWFLRAADLGSAPAMFALALCYEDGVGVPLRLDVAAAWYRRASDLFGHAGAMNNLGLCYQDGRGIEQSVTQAVQCFQQAALKGHVSAKHNLAVCYATGSGVWENPGRAVELHTQAAAAGHPDSAYVLGCAYTIGELGRDVDMDLGRRYLQNSAALGHAQAKLMLERLSKLSGKDMSVPYTPKLPAIPRAVPVPVQQQQALVAGDDGIKSSVDARNVAGAFE